jgi:hypothetical protein
MENKNTTEPIKKKSNWKMVVLIFSALIILVTGFVYLMISTARDNAERMQKQMGLYRKESLENSVCSFKRDSLQREVNSLSIYRSLTKAMVHRDEATSLLKYKVGDFVYMKRDSVKVVISDIVIGGSKYEYYVRYKVLHKDKTEEEVIPELLY